MAGWQKSKEGNIYKRKIGIYCCLILFVIPAPVFTRVNYSGNPVIMKKTYYIYILASKRSGTLYVGVTNDLVRRVLEHKNKVIKGFTDKYDVNKLVY